MCLTAKEFLWALVENYLPTHDAFAIALRKIPTAAFAQQLGGAPLWQREQPSARNASKDAHSQGSNYQSAPRSRKRRPTQASAPGTQPYHHAAHEVAEALGQSEAQMPRKGGWDTRLALVQDGLDLPVTVRRVGTVHHLGSDNLQSLHSLVRLLLRPFVVLVLADSPLDVNASQQWGGG